MSSKAKFTIKEEWINSENTKLYSKQWIPVGKIKATMVFVHGLGEHVNRYDMFELFATAGIKVVGYDQRGFGNTVRQSGLHGHSEGLKTQLADIKLISNRTKIDGLPHFLMGHSMGGGLTLLYAAQNPNEFTGVIASAPLISPGHKATPSSVEKIALSVIPQLLPSFVIPNALDLTTLTRDPIELKKYIEDPLVHSWVSAQLVSDLCFEFPKLLTLSLIQTFKMPIYLTHGTADGLTCPKASKKFMELIPSSDKTFKEFPGYYHELHNEPINDRKVIVDGYIGWILEHS
ncbi:Alpha/Beta hydrolase protein [Globomyces pollinis-pini]|nr:Alpha/Beta hydrolase protein [Globomyces pollinis-pini]